MEMLCPECLGKLVSPDGRTARCTVHGGEFKILFQRDARQTMENTPSPPIPGSSPEGAAAPAESTTSGSPLRQGLDGMRCVQHPSVPAVQKCQLCGAYMCATCDFALPNGMHLCPSCATAPQTALGPKRKRAMIWSYVCAAGATLGFVLTIGLAAMHPAKTNADEQALGVLMMLVVLIPGVVGVGLGLGAIDRRYNNPPSLWVAAIWNCVIVAIFVLMAIVGNLK